MKKVSLIKGFLVILLSVVLIGTTGVFAADELDFDLDDNTSSNTSNTSNSSNTANNTNKNNTNTNSNKSNTNKSNTNTNNTNTNNANANKNSSTYNNTNTNLPKTGIEDSIPTAVLIVIFAISAVYAYKKISDYKNV